ncbi:septal ring lytic transglycosylase RlpA family protein [Aliidiomarina sp. Khilg15.8]
MPSKYLLILLGVSILAGCSSQPASRYQLHKDEAPTRLPTPSELEPLTPRFEPLSRQGNMASYTVLGQTYEVLYEADDYDETGIASWYGKKFHGHLTSNGEYYDMYSMSAAHRYLPLPTYVRVTNLANDKEVIVRVNDRGPFHPDRIIDLSYAAAFKLDMLDTGTAQVRVEAIVMSPPTVPDVISEARYVQVTASASRERVNELQQALQEIYTVDATTRERDGLHRLLLGPFSESQANRWLQRLRTDGYQEAFRVSE